MAKNPLLDQPLDQQLNYINNRLLTESMRAISLDLNISRVAIPTIFKKHNYRLNKDTNQYVKINLVENEVAVSDNRLDHKPDHKPIPNSSPNVKQTFSIPVKTKVKANTQAFNIVCKVSLVEKLDYIRKNKNYSRNELINYMLNWCVDNMEDQGGE